MGAITEIAWTDHTFNPWIGCTKVSAGCKNCYAKTRDDRHMMGPISHWGPGAPRHVTSASNWKEPLKWAKAARHAGIRERVFCASLADIFDKEAPVSARQDLWKLIGDTYDALDWQLLTKRPENIVPVMCEDLLNFGFFELTHCWLGTSTENQDAADLRIPSLLDVDAAVRFLSCEPLLGPLAIDRWLTSLASRWPEVEFGSEVLPGVPFKVHPDRKIDWVIAGGESGPGARPMRPSWARSLRDQCEDAGVAFFFKQWGAWAPSTAQPIRGKYTGGGLFILENGQCGNQGDWWGGRAEAVDLVGKKAAGALLDGVEWKQFPAVQA